MNQIKTFTTKRNLCTCEAYAEIFISPLLFILLLCTKRTKNPFSFNLANRESGLFTFTAKLCVQSGLITVSTSVKFIETINFDH